MRYGGGGMGDHEVLMDSGSAESRLSDAERLLLCLHAADAAEEVKIDDANVDGLVCLLNASEKLHFDYRFYYLPQPWSSEVHEDLETLVSRGEIEHNSPYVVTQFGRDRLAQKLGDEDELRTLASGICEDLRAIVAMDERERYRLLYVNL